MYILFFPWSYFIKQFNSQSTSDDLSHPLSAASLPSTSITSPAPDSETTTWGTEVLQNAQLKLIAAALHIDPALTHRSKNAPLSVHYQKFNAWNDAVAEYARLKSANEWTLADTNRTELINLFS